LQLPLFTAVYADSLEPAAVEVYAETPTAGRCCCYCRCCCFCFQLPLITAVYAGTPELPAAVEASIRAQQNNDASVSMGLAAARILEKVR
jgi:hypothetical protein